MACPEPDVDAGLDLSLFLEPVPDDLICVICRAAVSDPHVTEQCGHLFCRTCIFRGLQEQRRCPVCRGDVHADQLRRDLRAQRQIQRLRVRCTNRAAGCEWIGALSDLPAHAASCVHRPVACPYAALGCSEVLTRPELFDHEQRHISMHLGLVNDALGASRRRVEVLEQEQPVLLHTICTLRGELKAARQQQRQRDTETATARSLLEQELQLLRREVQQLRMHVGRGVSDRHLDQCVKWDAARTNGKFEISSEGTKALHTTPGWASIVCATGVSRGQHEWHVRVDPPADGSAVNPSTVMIGVATATKATSHLGNTAGAWCYQLNGFRWDGRECLAYGECAEDVAGDVITMLLDLDTGSLEFKKNGSSLGAAYHDVGGLVFPAVSLCTEGHSVSILTELDLPQGPAKNAVRASRGQ
eukprot:TRINITY_DN39602_c0_g1_i1.p1 TRINITY_DN39602_c0_g1~~TRINITY_DN39602_c0_g1_i1.p1  ORF type:complete len:429 (+),score=130.70 TRINITY_DN39602_c0_g1_i1:44-1288(+)